MRNAMSRYTELGQASAQGAAQRAQELELAEDQEGQRQKVVKDFLLKMIAFLEWPPHLTSYVDLATNRPIGGPVEGFPPPLLYNVVSDAGELRNYSTGVQLRLIEQGSGSVKELWLRFAFHNNGTMVVFGNHSYGIPTYQEQAFADIFSDIKTALLSGTDIFPLRLFWESD
jgi:hypothetical protein